MNKYLIQSIVAVVFVLFISNTNFNPTLISTNSLKQDFVSGNFQQVSNDLEELLSKASLINPAFIDFQSKIPEQISKLSNNFQTYITSVSKQSLIVNKSSFPEVNPAYLDLIQKFKGDLEGLEQILLELNTVIDNPEFKFQDSYIVNSQITSSLQKVQDFLNSSNQKISLVENLLGLKRKNNLLVLLQNDYEFRATGGFISAVLDIEIYNGKVQKFELIDIYDLDGQYLPDRISPYEFADFNQDLFIRDANYQPDFAKTSQLINSQISQSIYKSYDFIAAINLSLLEDLFPQAIPFKFEFTFLNKQNLQDRVQTYFLQSLDLLLASPDLLAKTIRGRDIQISSSNPVFEDILQSFNLSLKLKPGILTISKANLNGYKSLFDQESSLEIVVDHSQTPVKKSIAIQSSHPFTNQNQIYLESTLKQLNVSRKQDDLYSALKKEIQNAYRFYIPDFQNSLSPKVKIFDTQTPNPFAIVFENLDVENNKSSTRFEYQSSKAQYDFFEQLELVNFKHYKSVSLKVILPEDKVLFSPVFDSRKIAENTYEIPFEAEFIVIDKY